MNRELMMVEQTLYPGVDSMLSSEALSTLLQMPVRSVQRTPLAEGLGTSRNQKEFVVINDNAHARFFLKQMSPDNDWLMHATHDMRCRAVTLWQYGVLDRLLPDVDHAVIACSYDGDTWGILMRDVSQGILPDRLNKSQIFWLLDGLTAIHANFWNAPALNDPGLGLCDSATVIDALSVQTASALSMIPSILPDAILEGWTVLEDRLEPDIWQALRALMANPTPLCDALSRYPSTLIHGDYRPGESGNLALLPGAPPQVAVLDWQLAGHSLMTIDLGWFVNNQRVSPVISVGEATTYYRSRLETRLGPRLETDHWPAMLDLGLLVNVLRHACFIANYARQHPDEMERAIGDSIIMQYQEQVRAGLRWL
jgi:hypothetical protein